MQTKGIEKISEEGAIEIKVETVDEPNKEKVTVVHLHRYNDKGSGSGGGILSNAVAAVTNTLESAKDAIMRTSKDYTTTNNNNNKTSTTTK